MSKIIIKNSYEIDLIKKSAQIVSKTLGMLANEIKPGISSLKLELPTSHSLKIFC